MEEFFKSIREQRLAQKVHIANQIDFTSEVPEELKKAVENTIQKGKSFPIGTIHNGYKKVSDGKWMKVSEYGMTKKEHESKKGDLETKNGGLGDSHMYGHWLKNDEVREHDSHSKSAKRLSDKEYSDEEVVGGEKKEGEANTLNQEEIRDKLSEDWSNLSTEDRLDLLDTAKYNGKEAFSSFSEVPKPVQDRMLSYYKKYWLEGNIEKSLNDISKYTDIDEIEKSIGHKYFKREGTQGNYKYYYTEEDYKAGRSSSGDKGKGDVEVDLEKMKSNLQDKYSCKVKYSSMAKSGLLMFPLSPKNTDITVDNENSISIDERGVNSFSGSHCSEVASKYGFTRYHSSQGVDFYQLDVGERLKVSDKLIKDLSKAIKEGNSKESKRISDFYSSRVNKD